MLGGLKISLTVLFLCPGDKLLDVQSGCSESVRGVPTIHYTFLFNTFVMMILFNELCARRLDLSPNVFTQLHRSHVFVVIWIASFATQVCRLLPNSTFFITANSHLRFRYLRFPSVLFCTYIFRGCVFPILPISTPHF